MKPRKVFVAVPIIGRPRPEIDQALSFLQGQPVKGVSFTSLRVVDCYPRHFAFNTIAGMFYESGCDDLWLIEHDMVCPHKIVQLLDMDEDICAARYINLAPDGRPGVTIRLMAFDRVTEGKDAGLYIPISPFLTGIRPVDGVGLGCTLIRGHVMLAALKNPRMALSQAGLAADDAPNVFQAKSKVNGQQIGTEDLDFCGRAKSCGFSIAANLDVRCGHFKEVDLDQLERKVAMAAISAASRVSQVAAAAP